MMNLVNFLDAATAFMTGAAIGSLLVHTPLLLGVF